MTDILLLDSDGVSGEAVTLWGHRWEFTLRGSWERRQRPIGDVMNHYSTSGKLALRF